MKHGLLELEECGRSTRAGNKYKATGHLSNLASKMNNRAKSTSSWGYLVSRQLGLQTHNVLRSTPGELTANLCQHCTNTVGSGERKASETEPRHLLCSGRKRTHSCDTPRCPRPCTHDAGVPGQGGRGTRSGSSPPDPAHHLKIFRFPRSSGSAGRPAVTRPAVQRAAARLPHHPQQERSQQRAAR